MSKPKVKIISGEIQNEEALKARLEQEGYEVEICLVQQLFHEPLLSAISKQERHLGFSCMD